MRSVRFLRLFGVALFALLALGVASVSSASATVVLPDVSLLVPPETGERYPIHLEVTLLVRTKLSNPVKNLEGSTLLLLYLTTVLSSLGLFEALFQGVHTGNEKCNSTQGETDRAGEVLTRGTFHVVPLTLNAERTHAATLGILYEPEEVLITCGTTKIKVKGTLLSSVQGISNGVDTNLLGGELRGNGAGTPNITKYFNDAGEEKEVKLEANFGTGFRASAEEVEELVKVHILPPNTMFMITF
jgi:hypothetical protein